MRKILLACCLLAAWAGVVCAGEPRTAVPAPDSGAPAAEPGDKPLIPGWEEPGPPDAKPKSWATEPSHLVDNGNGTITDPKTGLMWARQDSYQTLQKWLNWNMAKDYVDRLNAEKFAGHDDWRFPTREELASLFDETKFIVWKYYWTTNEIHLDPLFVNPHCCVWSGETYDKKPEFAWAFNFIRGKTYLSLKDTGVEYSLTAIRPVRPLKK